MRAAGINKERAKTLASRLRRAELRALPDTRARKAAYDVLYYAANREEKAIYYAGWREANPQKKKDGDAAFHARRRADGTAAVQQRAYSKTPNGRLHSKRSKHARRATELAAPLEPFTAADLAAHIAALGGRCVYCPGPYEHLDHVYPLARGGAHALSNLVPSCAPCNLSKGDALPLQWLLGSDRVAR